MSQSFPIKWPMLAAFSLALAGCGGGTSVEKNNDGGDGVTTTPFGMTVTGNAEPPSEDTVAVSASQNQGAFTISWNASISSYHADYYVSGDQLLNVDDDILFLSKNCTTGIPSNCGVTGSVQCTFTSGMDVFCQDSELTGQASWVLNPLPKQAYILQRLCSADQEECSVYSQRVEFQP